MKCSKGHEMQPIIVAVRPRSSEWYCGVGDYQTGCHESKEMTPDEIYQLSGGRVVTEDEPGPPAPRARR